MRWDGFVLLATNSTLFFLSVHVVGLCSWFCLSLWGPCLTIELIWVSVRICWNIGFYFQKSKFSGLICCWKTCFLYLELIGSISLTWRLWVCLDRVWVDFVLTYGFWSIVICVLVFYWFFLPTLLIQKKQEKKLKTTFSLFWAFGSYPFSLS